MQEARFPPQPRVLEASPLGLAYSRPRAAPDTWLRCRSAVRYLYSHLGELPRHLLALRRAALATVLPRAGARAHCYDSVQLGAGWGEARGDASTSSRGKISAITFDRCRVRLRFDRGVAEITPHSTHMLMRAKSVCLLCGCRWFILYTLNHFRQKVASVRVLTDRARAPGAGDAAEPSGELN